MVKNQDPYIIHEGEWQCIVCNHKYSSVDVWWGKVRWSPCPRCGIPNNGKFTRDELIRKQADWFIDEMLGVHGDEEVSD